MRILVVLVTLMSMASQPSFAGHLDSFRELFLKNEFVLEEDSFRGSFRDAEYWRGNLCNSYWKYRVSLWGGVDDISFDMNDDGSVNVEGRLEDIHGHVKGQYRGWASACLATELPIGVSAAWARLKGRVWFHETDGGEIKVTVKILSTRIGKLEFYGYFPDWIENLATKAVNKGMEKIWKSELGDWLNEKASKYIQENIPADQLPI